MTLGGRHQQHINHAPPAPKKVAVDAALGGERDLAHPITCSGQVAMVHMQTHLHQACLARRFACPAVLINSMLPPQHVLP